MKIGFVVLSYKNIDDTVECIKSIQQVNLNSGDSIVTILVDNSECDTYPTGICENVSVDYLFQVPNDGYANGNNIGIKKAIDVECDYIVVINNDTIVFDDFLYPLLEVLNEQPMVALAAPVILTAKEKQIWSSGGYYRKRFCNYTMTREELSENTENEFINGCCFCFKAELIDQVGYISESYFMYNEDSDWCYKIKEKKLKNYVCPQSVILHKVSLSSKPNSPFQLYYIYRNRIRFAYDNLRGMHRIYGVFINCLQAIYRLIRMLISKKFSEAKAIRYAIADFRKHTGRYRY